MPQNRQADEDGVETRVDIGRPSSVHIAVVRRRMVHVATSRRFIAAKEKTDGSIASGAAWRRSEQTTLKLL